MSDARSNWCQKFPFKRVIAAITVAAFITTTVATDLAWARPSSSVVASTVPGGAGSNRSAQSGTGIGFTLPPSLGTIKDSWYPSERATRNAQRATIIHIQDAHCNYYAQHKINDIIEYIIREYGVDAINLEGGTGDYNLSIFTDIADKNIRERIADYFVKEGLMSGAEYFAVNNPDKAKLWGIEDSQLYIDNLRIYRDSLKYRPQVDKYIKSLNHILAKLKRSIFSKELSEIDAKYAAYKAGKLELKDYLAYLVGLASYPQRRARLNVPYVVDNFPNIQLLAQSINEEKGLDFKAANNERDKLIDRLQRVLSKNELESLVQKTVAFKKEQLSQSEFYAYLVGRAKFMGIGLAEYPNLKKYVAYISAYDAVDKLKVIEEMDRLEAEIRESMYENDMQRRLDKLSKNLALMRNLFDISLTKEDYKYYKTSEDSFDVSNFTAFIGRARLNVPYPVDNLLDRGIVQLDDYRRQMARFYEYSIKRDYAFLNNTKFKNPWVRGRNQSRTTNSEQRTTIVITGGFHTENLCELYRKNNISYVSIMPNFKSSDQYECPYFALLADTKQSPVDKTITKIVECAIALASAWNGLSAMVNAEFKGKKEAGGEEVKIQLKEAWIAAVTEGRSGIIVTKNGKILGVIGTDGRSVDDFDETQRPGFESVDIAKIGTSQPAAPSAAAEKSSAATLPIREPRAEDLLNTPVAGVFAEQNPGGKLFSCNLEADFVTDPNVILSRLEKDLAKASEEDYVLVRFKVDSGNGNYSYIVAIDRKPVIRKFITNCEYGRMHLDRFKFFYKVDVEADRIHLHFIQIADNLQRQGHMSETFPAIVRSLARAFPGKRITAHAIDPLIAHWFVKYFEGHFLRDPLCTQDRQRGSLNNSVTLYRELAYRLVALGVITEEENRGIQSAKKLGEAYKRLEEAVAAAVKRKNGDKTPLEYLVELIRNGTPDGKIDPISELPELPLEGIIPAQAPSAAPAVTEMPEGGIGKGQIPLFKWIYGKIFGLSGKALDISFDYKWGPRIEELVFTAGAMSLALLSRSANIIVCSAATFVLLHLFGAKRPKLAAPLVITAINTMLQLFIGFPALEGAGLIVQIFTVGVIWFVAAEVHLRVNRLSDPNRQKGPELRKLAWRVIAGAVIFIVLSFAALRPTESQGEGTPSAPPAVRQTEMPAAPPSAAPAAETVPERASSQTARISGAASKLFTIFAALIGLGTATTAMGAERSASDVIGQAAALIAPASAVPWGILTAISVAALLAYILLPRIIVKIGEIINRPTSPAAPIRPAEERQTLMDRYRAAIRGQDIDEVRRIISDAGKASPQEAEEFLLYAVNINAAELVIAAAQQLKSVLLLNPSLDREEAVKKVRERMEKWEGYPIVVQGLSGILSGLAGSGMDEGSQPAAARSPRFKPALQAEIVRFKESVRRSPGPAAVDRALFNFEKGVRSLLSMLSGRDKETASREVAKSLSELEAYLITKGFLAAESPLGLSDERAFVLYKIAEEEVSRTSQGPVKVYYLNQVTEYSDGMLRGNPGWSSLFTDYVVVFRESISRSDKERAEKLLEGERPFKPTRPNTPKGRQIARMASICGALIIKGLAGHSADRRLELQEEATKLHEVEHEIRRRMLKLKEGDVVHGSIDEELSDLRALIDSKEPWHHLAHIVELAAGDMVYAWTLLGRLADSNDAGSILEWLERCVAGNNVDELRASANRAFAAADSEWNNIYGKQLKRARSPAPAAPRGVSGKTDENVSCGTICESGHRGSLNALNSQLERQFEAFRKALKAAGAKAEGDLTEKQADAAFWKMGLADNMHRLADWRRAIRELASSIPDDIQIFFSVPEGGTELFWVGNDYGAGHFSKDKRRIHISLPFLRRHGVEMAARVAMHEYIHILNDRHETPGAGLDIAIGASFKSDTARILKNIWTQVSANSMIFEKFGHGSLFIEGWTSGDLVRAAAYLTQFRDGVVRNEDDLKQLMSRLEWIVDAIKRCPDIGEWSELSGRLGELLTDNAGLYMKERIRQAEAAGSRVEVPVVNIACGDIIALSSGADAEILSVNSAAFDQPIRIAVLLPDGRIAQYYMEDIYASYWTAKGAKVATGEVVAHNIDVLISASKKEVIRDANRTLVDYVYNVAFAVDPAGRIIKALPENDADRKRELGELAGCREINLFYDVRTNTIDIDRVSGDIASRRARDNILLSAERYNVYIEKEARAAGTAFFPEGPVAGAAHEGHEGEELYREMKALEAKMIAAAKRRGEKPELVTKNLDRLVSALKSKHTRDNKAAIEKVLSLIGAVGIGDNLDIVDVFKGRMILIKMDEKRLSRGEGRLGGLIILHNGVRKIVLPRSTIEELQKVLLDPAKNITSIDQLDTEGRRFVGDILHEIIEIGMLGRGIHRNEAHFYAQHVQNALVEGCVDAAREEFKKAAGQAKDPYKLARLERRFAVSVDHALTDTGIKKGVVLDALTDDQIRRLGRRFVELTLLEGDYISALFERFVTECFTRENFENYLNAEREKTRRAGRHLDAEDMILVLQRLHAIANAMPAFHLTEDAVIGFCRSGRMHSLLTGAERGAPTTVPTPAIEYEILKRCGLAGDAWDGPAAAKALEQMKKDPDGVAVLLGNWRDAALAGRHEEATQWIGKVIGKFNSLEEKEERMIWLKAVCEFFGIDPMAMAKNSIMNWLVKCHEQGILIERSGSSKNKIYREVRRYLFNHGIIRILNACASPEMAGIVIEGFVGRGADSIALKGKLLKDANGEEVREDVIIKIMTPERPAEEEMAADKLLARSQSTFERLKKIAGYTSKLNPLYFTENIRLLRIKYNRGKQDVVVIDRLVPDAVAVETLVNGAVFDEAGGAKMINAAAQILEGAALLLDPGLWLGPEWRESEKAKDMEADGYIDEDIDNLENYLMMPNGNVKLVDPSKIFPLGDVASSNIKKKKGPQDEKALSGEERALRMRYKKRVLLTALRILLGEEGGRRWEKDDNLTENIGFGVYEDIFVKRFGEKYRGAANRILFEMQVRYLSSLDKVGEELATLVEKMKGQLTPANGLPAPPYAAAQREEVIIGAAHGDMPAHIRLLTAMRDVSDKEGCELAEEDSMWSCDLFSSERERDVKFIPITRGAIAAVAIDDIRRGRIPDADVKMGFVTMVETNNPYTLHTRGLGQCTALAMHGRRNGKSVLILAHVPEPQSHLIGGIITAVTNEGVTDVKGMAFVHPSTNLVNEIEDKLRGSRIAVVIKKVGDVLHDTTDLCVTQDGITAARKETDENMSTYTPRNLHTYLWSDLTPGFEPGRAFNWLSVLDTVEPRTQKHIPIEDVLTKLDSIIPAALPVTPAAAAPGEIVVQATMLNSAQLSTLREQGILYLGDRQRYDGIGGATDAEMGKILKISADDPRYIMTGAGPCIELIINNRASRTTYVAHSYGLDITNVITAIDKAADDPAMKNTDEIEAVVAGGGVISDSELEEVYRQLANRSAVLERLSAAGFRNVRQVFPGHVDIDTNLVFDRSTGEFEAAFRPALERAAEHQSIEQYVEDLGKERMRLEPPPAIPPSGPGPANMGAPEPSAAGEEASREEKLLNDIRGVALASDVNTAAEIIAKLNEELPPEYDPLIAARLYAAFTDEGEIEEALKMVERNGIMPDLKDNQATIDSLDLSVERLGIFAQNNKDIELNAHLVAFIMFAIWHPDPELRRTAVEALQFLKESKEFDLEAVRKYIALNGHSIAERILAIRGMGMNGDIEALNDVLEGNGNSTVRSCAIRQIAVAMNPASCATLVPYVFSTVKKDAIAAIKGMENLGAPETVLIFAALKDSQDKDIADAAEKAFNSVVTMIITSRRRSPEPAEPAPATEILRAPPLTISRPGGNVPAGIAPAQPYTPPGDVVSVIPPAVAGELPPSLPAGGIGPVGAAAGGEVKVDTIDARKQATLKAAADVTGRGQIVKVIAGVPCELELRTKVGNTVLEINRELAKRGFGIIRVDENYQAQEPDERQASTFHLYINDPKATEESCKQAVEAARAVMKRQGVSGQIVMFAPVNLVNALRTEYGDSVIIVPDAYSDCDASRGWYTDVVARVILGRLIAAIKELDNKEKETGIKNDELRLKILSTMSDYLAGISENKEEIKDARDLVSLLNKISSGLCIRPVDYNKDFRLYRESQIATAVSA